MSVPTFKKKVSEIALHISSTLRDLHTGMIFLFFPLFSHSKLFCSELASLVLDISTLFLGVSVYIDVFHYIIFYYHFTAT